MADPTVQLLPYLIAVGVPVLIIAVVALRGRGKAQVAAEQADSAAEAKPNVAREAGRASALEERVSQLTAQLAEKDKQVLARESMIKEVDERYRQALQHSEESQQRLARLEECEKALAMESHETYRLRTELESKERALRELTSQVEAGSVGTASPVVGSPLPSAEELARLLQTAVSNSLNEHLRELSKQHTAEQQALVTRIEAAASATAPSPWSAADLEQLAKLLGTRLGEKVDSDASGLALIEELEQRSEKLLERVLEANTREVAEQLATSHQQLAAKVEEALQHPHRSTSDHGERLEQVMARLESLVPAGGDAAGAHELEAVVQQAIASALEAHDRNVADKLKTSHRQLAAKLEKALISQGRNAADDQQLLDQLMARLESHTPAAGADGISAKALEDVVCQALTTALDRHDRTLTDQLESRHRQLAAKLEKALNRQDRSATDDQQLADQLMARLESLVPAAGTDGTSLPELEDVVRKEISSALAAHQHALERAADQPPLLAQIEQLLDRGNAELSRQNQADNQNLLQLISGHLRQLETNTGKLTDVVTSMELEEATQPSAKSTIHDLLLGEPYAKICHELGMPADAANVDADRVEVVDAMKADEGMLVCVLLRQEEALREDSRTQAVNTIRRRLAAAGP